MKHSVQYTVCLPRTRFQKEINDVPKTIERIPNCFTTSHLREHTLVFIVLPLCRVAGK